MKKEAERGERLMPAGEFKKEEAEGVESQSQRFFFQPRLATFA
jgi:hypothetical protein